MRWPAWTYSPGQHEGAVDHGRHGAADRAILDVDVLLRELGFEVRRLVIEGGDLRVDHAGPVVLDPRLVEAALGLLVFGLELQDLAFELRHRGLGHLELALAGHATLEQRPVALELELRQVEIGLERGQGLFANRDGGRARARERIGLVLVQPTLGQQLGTLGLDALDLRAQGVGAQLGHAIVDAGHDLARGHARSLERRHLHHPAVGAAGDGHDVGGRARIVFVDVRQPQVELAAAIGHRQRAGRRRRRGNAGGTAGGRGRETMRCRAAGGRSRGLKREAAAAPARRSSQPTGRPIGPKLPTWRPKRGLSSKQNKTETILLPSVPGSCCNARHACPPLHCGRRRPLQTRRMQETVEGHGFSPLA